MKLLRLFARRSQGQTVPAPAPLAPGPVWAIGDVHGQCRLLKALEKRIQSYESGRTGATARIIYLGDYVDRGPDSAGVLDHLLSPPPDGIERHLLRGNHEEMFAAFLESPDPAAPWLDHGGSETLASYGLWLDRLPKGRRHIAAALAAYVPESHRVFLDQLEDIYRLPAPDWTGGQILFVHAGIDPALPADAQPTTALRWIREPFLSAERIGGPVVIHGHTPVERPEHMRFRINIDTGAGLNGPLTAVRLDPDGEVVFEQVTPE